MQFYLTFCYISASGFTKTVNIMYHVLAHNPPVHTTQILLLTYARAAHTGDFPRVP